MEKKGVIFDLDGVIVFTDKLHYRAWKKMADEIGVYFDEEINNRLRGVSRRESLHIILEHGGQKPYTEEEKEELAERKNRYYRELLHTMTPLDVPEEVRRVLTRLKEKRYLLAIGSSSKNAPFILERVKLTDAFDAVCDGNHISRSKPDPEVFLKAADYLSLKPEECIVVEDAFSGIDAAKAAGMYAAAVGDAVGHSQADVRLTSLTELMELL